MDQLKQWSIALNECSSTNPRAWCWMVNKSSWRVCTRKPLLIMLQLTRWMLLSFMFFALDMYVDLCRYESDLLPVCWTNLVTSYRYSRMLTGRRRNWLEWWRYRKRISAVTLMMLSNRRRESTRSISWATWVVPFLGSFVRCLIYARFCSSSSASRFSITVSLLSIDTYQQSVRVVKCFATVSGSGLIAAMSRFDSTSVQQSICS